MSPLAEVAGIYALPSSGAIGLRIVALIGDIFTVKSKVWGFGPINAILAVPWFPIGTIWGHQLSYLFRWTRRNLIRQQQTLVLHEIVTYPRAAVSTIYP